MLNNFKKHLYRQLPTGVYQGQYRKNLKQTLQIIFLLCQRTRNKVNNTNTPLCPLLKKYAFYFTWREFKSRIKHLKFHSQTE